MSERIRCTVESMNYSACGLDVGDWFELDADGVHLPEGQGFCYFAMTNAIALARGRIGGAEAAAWLESRPRVCCPDPPEALWMTLSAAPEPDPDAAVVAAGTPDPSPTPEEPAR